MVRFDWLPVMYVVRTTRPVPPMEHVKYSTNAKAGSWLGEMRSVDWLRLGAKDKDSAML